MKRIENNPLFAVAVAVALGFAAFGTYRAVAQPNQPGGTRLACQEQPCAAGVMIAKENDTDKDGLGAKHGLQKDDDKAKDGLGAKNGFQKDNDADKDGLGAKHGFEKDNGTDKDGLGAKNALEKDNDQDKDGLGASAL